MEYIIYFVSHYGYLAIFILLVPGIFGIPVPDELLLTLVGYLALQGYLSLFPALTVVLAGAALGITLDDWVGRAVGVKLIRRCGPHFSLSPDWFTRLRERLHRYGACILCLGYFVPGVRHWVAIAAGMTKFPLAGFALFAYAGALVWSVFYILLGYFLGKEAGLWVERIGARGQIAAGLIVVSLLAYYLIRRKWPKISGGDCKPATP